MHWQKTWEPANLILKYVRDIVLDNQQKKIGKDPTKQ
jgi:hypothetical protein